MEQNNGGISNIIDEESLHGDKIVGYRSSSSSSSSRSNHFEVDIGEDDTEFLELEENDSNSVVLNPESPRMMNTLPQTCDLDMLYASIKQSPPVQVMGQSAGGDVNQSPSSMFGRKHRSNSDWSLASSESLFSIRTGNNSFSMDGGFYISKSGELNWIEDYSCFTPDGNKSCMSPGLPTVIDTSAENELVEKEETIETQNVSPVDSEREKGNLSASLSTDSFAFPILAGGSPSPSPTKAGAEKSEPAPTTPPAEATQTTPKTQPAIPKAGGNQWFHCFSCFPMCC